MSKNILLVLFTAFSFSNFAFYNNKKPNAKVGIWVHTAIKSSENEVLELKVYVDGKYKGNINKVFDEVNNCDTKGVLLLRLKEGEYEIKVKGIYKNKQDHQRQQKVEWAGVYNIEKGCNLIKIGENENEAKVEKSECEENGEITIYLDESMRSYLRDVRVYIDSTYCGNLSTFHETTRSCGDSGTITKKLSCGLHKIEIKAIRKTITKGENKYYLAFVELDLNSPCIILPITK